MLSGPAAKALPCPTMPAAMHETSTTCLRRGEKVKKVGMSVAFFKKTVVPAPTAGRVMIGVSSLAYAARRSGRQRVDVTVAAADPSRSFPSFHPI